MRTECATDDARVRFKILEREVKAGLDNTPDWAKPRVKASLESFEEVSAIYAEHRRKVDLWRGGLGRNLVHRRDYPTPLASPSDWKPRSRSIARRSFIMGAGGGLVAAAALRPSPARSQVASAPSVARPVISLLDYGADPTGVSDSTTAVQNAMAAGQCIAPSLQRDGVTPAVYKVSNVTVPNGADLIGLTQAGFISMGTQRPRFIPVSGASPRLFNVDGSLAPCFSGIFLDCGSTSHAVDGISAGSLNMLLRDCLFFECNRGVGGALAGSVQQFPTATWKTITNNCNFMWCNYGILGMVDCFTSIASFNGCTYGLYLRWQENSAVNTFGQCRFEWCGRSSHPNSISSPGVAGYGCYIDSNDVCFDGCKWDACGNAGMYLAGERVQVTGCSFERNGANVTSGTTLITTSSHIEFNGGRHNEIVGCGGHMIQTDGFVFSPAHWAYFTGTGTTNFGLIFQANDLSACQGSTAGATLLGPNNSNTTWFGGTLPSGGTGLSAIVVKNNLGTGTAAQDVDGR